jgi:hypothetical protein
MRRRGGIESDATANRDGPEVEKTVLNWDGKSYRAPDGSAFDIDTSWETAEETRSHNQKDQEAAKIKTPPSGENLNAQDSDDELMSQDRLDQLKLRVARRQLKSRVESIMRSYYIILASFGFSFWLSIHLEGMAFAIKWHTITGICLIFTSWVFRRFAQKNESPYLQAFSFMLLITGVPLIGFCLFSYIWTTVFFNKNWRDLWMSMGASMGDSDI